MRVAGRRPTALAYRSSLDADYLIGVEARQQVEAAEEARAPPGQQVGVPVAFLAGPAVGGVVEETEEAEGRRAGSGGIEDGLDDVEQLAAETSGPHDD